MVRTANEVLAQACSEMSGSRRMKEAAYLFSPALYGCNRTVGCDPTERLHIQVPG
jgi:hypothetical protein